MKGISKLKDDARKHEQREEWDKAISVYLEVIAAADAAGSGETELPLYNRVGDLCLRLGRPRDAVSYYEQAADKYAEAGLYNNAIALCNKALRYLPDQLEVIRRLGQYSASQGFLTDARRYFLEYADKKFAADDPAAALSAVNQYANISGDPDIRELLGRKLQEHGRTTEAVSELKRAYAMYLGAGAAEAAANLRRDILAIEPTALDEEAEGGMVPEPPQPRVLPEPLVELPDLPAGPPEPDELEPERGEDAAPLEGLEATMLGGDATGQVTAPQLADLEPSAEFAAEAAEAAEFAPVEGLDLPVEPDLEPAPDLQLPDGLLTDEQPELEAKASQVEGVLPGAEEQPETEPASLSGGYQESEAGFPEADQVAAAMPRLSELMPAEPAASTDAESELETGSLLAGQEEVEAASLPSEQAEPELPPLEELSEAGPLAALEEGAGLLEDWAEIGPSALPEEEEELLEEQAGAGPLPLLEDQPLPLLGEQAGAEPLPRLEEPGEPESAPPSPEQAEPEAIPLLGTSIEPEELPLLGDDDRQVEFPLLGEAVDPVALPLLEEPSVGPQQPEGEVAGGPADDASPLPLLEDEEEAEEYVDLRSLLVEAEPPGSTRFTVNEQATGDEDEDFAELLSQFKRKVAANVAPGDAAAHYDLGLAFKDMGLLDEAIAELQVALRAGDMRIKVYEELGHCFLLKKDFSIAEKVLRQALKSSYDDELELLGVYYHLGRACEELGKPDLARDAYERVLAIDINFSDVSDRIARL